MEVEKGAARSEPAANDEDVGGGWASRGHEEARTVGGASKAGDGRGRENGGDETRRRR